MNYREPCPYNISLSEVCKRELEKLSKFYPHRRETDAGFDCFRTVRGKSEMAVGFDRAVAGFLMGLEPATRRRHRSEVSRWLAWCRDNLVEPPEAQLAHLEGYMRWLREVRGLSKASVRATASSVHGLYRYAAAFGAIEADPFERVRLPRVYGHSAGTCLDRDDAAHFMEEATRRGGDERALCSVLVLCGLRVSEAVGLDVEDFTPGETPTARIASRKGDWCQVVSLSPAVADAFEALVARRSSGPLLRLHGRRMKASEARAIVSDVARSVGVEGITPHSLRRTFATLARDAGVPDRDVMASGGWHSPQMLDYYDMGRRAARSSAPGFVIYAVSASRDCPSSQSIAALAAVVALKSQLAALAARETLKFVTTSATVQGVLPAKSIVCGPICPNRRKTGAP